MIPRVLLLVLAALTLQCAAGRELSPAEIAKVDIRLRPVVLGSGPAPAECEKSTDADGVRAYRVIVRGNPVDIRAGGIPLVSTLGDVCTAVLTVDQLREAAHMPAVRSLDCGSTNALQGPPAANH
jgi:hypothetical protein